MGDLDFLSLKDMAWEDRLPALSRTVCILKDKGIYEGEAFLGWMGDLLEAKGVRTFGDLLKSPDAGPIHRHKLQVIASDLTEQRLLVLPRDAHKLGVGRVGLLQDDIHRRPWGGHHGVRPPERTRHGTLRFRTRSRRGILAPGASGTRGAD